MSQNMIETDIAHFERRIVEIIEQNRYKSYRWRLTLLTSFVLTTISAFKWLSDSEIYRQSFIDSLRSHIFFTINLSIMFLLFYSAGIHQRIIESDILIDRIREVIQQYNLGCDHTGKLVLRPPFRN